MGVVLALVLSAAFGAGDQYLGSLSWRAATRPIRVQTVTIAEVAAGLLLAAYVVVRRYSDSRPPA